MKTTGKKYRVYLHLTTEGKAKPEHDKSGNPRHKFVTGIIGTDIGTQTVAYTPCLKAEIYR